VVAGPYEHWILDTSTVIELSQLDDSARLPTNPPITAVTLAELSVGPLVAQDAAERAARQVRLQQAESDFDPLPFDVDAARASDGSRRRYAEPVESQLPKRSMP
jgi:predicted nucleic acid-binding protein